MDSKSDSWVIETNLPNPWSTVWETWFLSEEEADEVETKWSEHLYHEDMKPRSLDACLAALRENREEWDWPSYRLVNKVNGFILYAGVLAQL